MPVACSRPAKVNSHNERESGDDKVRTSRSSAAVKHAAEAESARRGSNQQPHGPYAQTDPHFPEGEEREFDSLRGPSQHDDRQMSAPR